MPTYGPGAPPPYGGPPPGGAPRWLVPALVVAVLVVGGVLAAVLLTRGGSSPSAGPTAAATASASPTATSASPTPSPTTASPSPSPTSEAPTTAPPTTSGPGPALSNAALLAHVPGCRSGCALVGRRDGIHPDVSLVLVDLGAADAVERKLRFYSMRSDTGAVLDSGPSDPLVGVRPSGYLRPDRSDNVYAVFGTGAHSAFVVAVTVRSDGSLDDHGTFGNQDYFGEAGTTAGDVNGDGVYELLIDQNDCNPDCADGHHVVWAYGAQDDEYILFECRPPASEPYEPTGGKC